MLEEVSRYSTIHLSRNQIEKLLDTIIKDRTGVDVLASVAAEQGEYENGFFWNFVLKISPTGADVFSAEEINRLNILGIVLDVDGFVDDSDEIAIKLLAKIFLENVFLAAVDELCGTDDQFNASIDFTSEEVDWPWLMDVLNVNEILVDDTITTRRSIMRF